MEYAIIENNKISNVVVCDEAFISKINGTVIRIDNLDPKPAKGWDYDGTSFSFVEPEDTNIYLHLSTDKTTINANGVDTATVTATLKNASGVVQDITTTDYANIRNYGAKEVSFVNGSATITLTVPPEKSGKLEFTNADSTKYVVTNALTIWAVL